MRFAFGVGAVFTSLLTVGWSAIGTMMLHRPLIISDYWLMPFAFIVATSLTIIAISWPGVYSELMGHMAEAERWKTEAHRYRQERRAERAYLRPVTQVLDETSTEEKRHRALWRHFLIQCACESIRVDAISYQKMRGFFGDDRDKWRAYADRLVGW